jgi:hypothetical protein
VCIFVGLSAASGVLPKSIFLRVFLSPRDGFGFVAGVCRRDEIHSVIAPFFSGLPPKLAVLRDFSLCSVSGVRAHSARQSALSCLQPPPCFDCCSICAPMLAILDPRPVLSARSSSALISWPIPGSSSISFPARDARQDVLLACSFGFSFARASSPFLILRSEYSLSRGFIFAAAESERSSCQRRLVLRLQIFLYRYALHLGSVQLLHRLLSEYRLSLQALIFL